MKVIGQATSETGGQNIGSGHYHGYSDKSVTDSSKAVTWFKFLEILV